METEFHDMYYNRTFWCYDCNVPLLTDACHRCGGKGKHCASDLKPVFSEEREFWEQEIDALRDNGYMLPQNLFYGRRRIVHNGQTLFTIKVDNGGIKLGKNRLKNINNTSEAQDGESFEKRMLEANEPVLKNLERLALAFITETAEQFPDRMKTISFSGGKDSTVVATLVKQALGDTPLFFSDTTLEIPDTYEYIEEFARENSFELLTKRSSNDFFEMCRELEPPSHLMRWCCTVFKASPVSAFLNSQKCSVLTFDGVRKAESSARSRYPRLYRNKKITRQFVARPVFTWSTMAIWMYILWKELKFNPAYRKGYTRVGCYLCPFNSPYDDVLTRHFYPQLSRRWEEVLIEFAKDNGKGWDLKWVSGGFWKQRKPHRSNYRIVSHRLCSDQDAFKYSFEDRSVTRELLEFMKPFGSVEFVGSNFFRIQREGEFELTGILGGCTLKVILTDDHYRRTRTRLERQIEKSLNCVACGGCTGVCPAGAITTEQGFRIDDEKCTHCLNCVDTNFTSRGCIALAFKNERGRVA